MQLPAKSNDHMTRASFRDRSWMKNRKRRRKDTTEHLKYIQEMFRCTSYNLSETSIQVFLKFYSRNVNRYVWLCGAEPRKTTGTAFFYGELNSS